MTALEHEVDPAYGPVRSFRPRRGRVTPGQAAALDRLWPSYGVDVGTHAADRQPLDLDALFGRSAPVVLEIGCGMGEATFAMAAAQPAYDLLAVDVHTPGLGSLLRRVGEAGLTNVRVAFGDAVDLLTDMIASGSLAEVRVFFPDPWPKTRHRKRRLVGPAFCDLVADRLAPGGRLHLATDWAPYAERARGVLAAHPGFVLAEEIPWRPRTRFEQQGLDAGRPSQDVVAHRRPGHSP